MTQANYYDILGLHQDQPSPSPDEVKKAYRKALLSHHPDKHAKTDRQIQYTTKLGTLTVDDIALAYKTLSEPALKAEYDRLLAANAQSSDQNKSGGRVHHTGLETVDLDDLAYDEKTQSWTKSCRCGVGGFEVTEDELEKNLEDRELVVGCGGCSLWLRVLFSVEE